MVSSDPVTIAFLQFNTSNIVSLLVRNEDTLSNARFHFNDTDQLVNNSACHIDSLEVYRGREQAIEISHDGFSLTENGTIEVPTWTI